MDTNTLIFYGVIVLVVIAMYNTLSLTENYSNSDTQSTSDITHMFLAGFMSGDSTTQSKVKGLINASFSTDQKKIFIDTQNTFNDRMNKKFGTSIPYL
jgi:hypothetical protein